MTWIPIITSIWVGGGSLTYGIHSPPNRPGLSWAECSAIVEKLNRPNLFPHAIEMTAECRSEQELRAQYGANK
jgi:hypothetical protein